MLVWSNILSTLAISVGVERGVKEATTSRMLYLLLINAISGTIAVFLFSVIIIKLAD